MGDMDDILLAIQAVGLGTAGAVEGYRDQQSTDRMLDAAQRTLGQMEHPEAATVHDLLTKDPQAANKYIMSRYGSWDKMYSHLQNEMEEENAANAIEEAGGNANVPDYIRNRREYAAGMARAGGNASAGQMTALFPGPVSPQALGIDPEKWTGESMKEVMDNLSTTGLLDLTPLEARPVGAGGVPDNVKLPTGWLWNPTQVPAAQPIPGTNAEQNFLMNKIMKNLLAEGLSIEDYFKKYPEQKAFFDASLRRIAKDDPFLAALMDVSNRGSGGPVPTPGGGTNPVNPPTNRPGLELD